MKRLFVFGCSFTKYRWPTWADFLSTNYDEYYNYAQTGAGNRFIFEQLVETSMSYDFTADDTIVIVWSTYQRHDLFKDGKWITPGNVLQAEPIFDDDYVRKYFDIEGSVMHTLNYIRAAQEILGGWKADWYMGSMRSLLNPLSENNFLTNILRSPRTQSIFTEFPKLTKYGPVFEHDNWLSVSLSGYVNQFYLDRDFIGSDHHPTPTMHLNWLSEVAKSKPKLKPNKAARDFLDIWIQRFPGKNNSGIPIEVYLNELPIEMYEEWREENLGNLQTTITREQ